MNLQDMRELTAYRLANEAEAGGPDSPDSPGSVFLMRVRDALVERVAEMRDSGEEVDEDIVHELADSAVPIYTHERWQVFVDLTAYNEDVSELIEETSDLTAVAGVALYMIAARLCSSLLADLDEDEDDDE